jgi:hypothetical protein
MDYPALADKESSQAGTRRCGYPQAGCFLSGRCIGNRMVSAAAGIAMELL